MLNTSRLELAKTSSALKTLVSSQSRLLMCFLFVFPSFFLVIKIIQQIEGAVGLDPGPFNTMWEVASCVAWAPFEIWRLLNIALGLGKRTVKSAVDVWVTWCMLVNVTLSMDHTLIKNIYNTCMRVVISLIRSQNQRQDWAQCWHGGSKARLAIQSVTFDLMTHCGMCSSLAASQMTPGEYCAHLAFDFVTRHHLSH